MLNKIFTSKDIYCVYSVYTQPFKKLFFINIFNKKSIYFIKSASKDLNVVKKYISNKCFCFSCFHKSIKQ